MFHFFNFIFLFSKFNFFTFLAFDFFPFKKNWNFHASPLFDRTHKKLNINCIRNNSIHSLLYLPDQLLTWLVVSALWEAWCWAWKSKKKSHVCILFLFFFYFGPLNIHSTLAPLDQRCLSSIGFGLEENKIQKKFNF